MGRKNHIQQAYKIYCELNGDNLNDSDAWNNIETIADAWNRIAPMNISDLDEDEVFVFGSDTSGIHDGRASKLALEQFGAIYGEGEGLNGQSYALPTTKPKESQEEIVSKNIDGYKSRNKDSNKHQTKVDKEKLPKKEIEKNIKTFIECAKNNPQKNFLVTRVGCGFSAYNDFIIAPYFKEALMLSNVYLPQMFLMVLFDVKFDFDCPSDIVPHKEIDCSDFLPKMEYIMSSYLLWLVKIYKKEQPEEQDIEWLNMMDLVERICFDSVDAVYLSYRGLPAAAYEKIKDALDVLLGNKPYKNSETLSSNLIKEIKGENFFRMRKESDNWLKKEVGREGMFHIPLNLRNIVQTQRYSVPGFPCLYLGKHIRGCWEELGRPNLSDCLVSRFYCSPEKMFKVLDLQIPSKESWYKEYKVENGIIEDWKKLKNTIVTFPLIIASTFRSKRGSAYKPEYIVPQLILQYVKEYAYEKNRIKSKKEREIYGVAYTSVNVPEKHNDIVEQYCNYVLPIIDIKSKYCSKLQDLFKLSDPFCIEFENIKTSQEQAIANQDVDIFSKIEQHLIQKENCYLCKNEKIDGGQN